jgi:hypothetical protein
MKTLKEKYENKKFIKENRGLLVEQKENLRPQLDAVAGALTKIQSCVPGSNTAKQIDIIKKQIRLFARDKSLLGKIKKFKGAAIGGTVGAVGVGIGTALAVSTAGLGLPILGAIALIGGGGVGGVGGHYLSKLKKDPLTSAMLFATNLSQAYIDIATDIQQDLEKELEGKPANTTIGEIYRGLDQEKQKDFKDTFVTSGKGAFNKKLSGNAAFEDFIKMPIGNLPKIVNLSKSLSSVVKNVTAQMRTAGKILSKDEDFDQEPGSSPGRGSRGDQSQQGGGQRSGDNRGEGGERGQEGPAGSGRGESGSSQRSGGGSSSSPSQVRNIGELYSYLFSKSGKSANDREEKIKHAENYLKNEWGISDTENFRKFSKFLFDNDFI